VLVSSEVASLHLDADLVVLSACNTAGDGLKRGGKFGGPALSGLAESFFYAGGRAVLASHWQVPSASTVSLMTGLFQRLGPQLNGGVSDALRASQQVIAANPKTSHPFYWAAFTLIGDGSGQRGERAASN
jgi:CHAT domain-containing protein